MQICMHSLLSLSIMEAIMNEKQLQKLTEDLSLQFFSRPFLHKVSFNARLRTTGGRYLLQTHNIEINRKYYDVFGIEELEKIIKHELCHYHLHINHLPYQHKDRHFRDLLRKVGSNMYCQPLPNEKGQKSFRYIYICSRCEQIYYRKRKIDTARYRCGKCRGSLILQQDFLEER